MNCRKNRLSFFILLFILLSLFTACGTNDSDQEVDEEKKKEGWTLTFEDDFTGETIDQTKWEHAPEWERHNGQWSHDDAFLDGDGHLVIQISEKDDAFYSGAIRTRELFEQAYGYFEIRAKLPVDEGFWTAFWLMSDSVHDVGDEGRDGTEIDIFETPFARSKKIDHALHWDGYGPEHRSAGESIYYPEAYEDFATFALEWNEEEYIFYINEEETWRTSAGGVSEVPAYLKITAEIGDWAGDIRKADLPAEMLVDYVRVYEKNKDKEENQ